MDATTGIVGLGAITGVGLDPTADIVGLGLGFAAITTGLAGMGAGAGTSTGLTDLTTSGSFFALLKSSAC